jgi:hypothetical protein
MQSDGKRKMLMHIAALVAVTRPADCHTSRRYMEGRLSER